MKYCPTCETRYDEEVMRFCTKDGTPLIDEEQPHFVEMASETQAEPVEAAGVDDEAGEVTVVRRNIPVPPLPQLDDDDFSEPSERPSERIVVPMTPEPVRDPIRNRVSAAYYPPPKQNTFKVIVLTVLGTIIVLGMGAGLFRLLQRDGSNNANINLNANLNANQNANFGIDTNFNFNSNLNAGSANLNSNLNFNVNLRTPTPTPSPTPTPTPRPSPSATATPEPDETPLPTPRPTFDARPRTTPTPGAPARSTPRPTPDDQDN